MKLIHRLICYYLPTIPSLVTRYQLVALLCTKEWSLLSARFTHFLSSLMMEKTAHLLVFFKTRFIQRWILPNDNQVVIVTITSWLPLVQSTPCSQLIQSFWPEINMKYSCYFYSDFWSFFKRKSIEIWYKRNYFNNQWRKLQEQIKLF